jgi:hypothetical protein
MSSSTKSALGFLLRGMAWLLFAVAGLAFWVGGRAINEFARTGRMLAEMEGIALAAVCAGLGAVVKSAGENLKEDEGETTPTA